MVRALSRALRRCVSNEEPLDFGAVVILKAVVSARRGTEAGRLDVPGYEDCVYGVVRHRERPLVELRLDDGVEFLSQIKPIRCWHVRRSAERDALADAIAPVVVHGRDCPVRCAPDERNDAGHGAVELICNGLSEPRHVHGDWIRHDGASERGGCIPARISVRRGRRGTRRRRRRDRRRRRRARRRRGWRGRRRWGRWRRRARRRRRRSRRRRGWRGWRWRGRERGRVGTRGRDGAARVRFAAYSAVPL